MATYAVRRIFRQATTDTTVNLKQADSDLLVESAAETAFDFTNFGREDVSLWAGADDYAAANSADLRVVKSKETLRMTPAAADTHISIFTATGESIVEIKAVV